MPSHLSTLRFWISYSRLCGGPERRHFIINLLAQSVPTSQFERLQPMQSGPRPPIINFMIIAGQLAIITTGPMHLTAAKVIQFGPERRLPPGRLHRRPATGSDYCTCELNVGSDRAAA